MIASLNCENVSQPLNSESSFPEPEAPGDVVISSYDTTTITVGWTIKSDTVYDGFEIFYTDKSTSNTQKKKVANGNKRSAELTGLVAGESYDIYMKSYSVDEVSENSTTVTQRTKPEVPEYVTISSYDTTTITVGWTIDSDTVYDGFEIFYIDKSTSSTQKKQVNDKSKRSAELTGLVAGESYDIYMRSYSVDESPKFQNMFTISSYDTTTITIGWTIDSDTVFDGFEIFYTDESTSNTQTKHVNDKSKSSAELTGLVAGESYDVYMRSVSGDEVSENSTTVNQRTKPESPENVVISSYDTTTITIGWTIDSDTVFDGFEIFYTDESTSNTQTKQVNDKSKRSAELTGLVAGESYDIFMRSVSGNEVSENSTTVTQRTKPEAPENVVISSYDTTTITVGWTIDSDTVYDGFEIFYTDESTSITQTKQVNDKSKRSAELTGLVAGESYDIYMRSYSVDEVSENSTTVTQRTKPEVPEDVVISSYDTTTITVGWIIERDTVFDGFEIFYTDESSSSTQTKKVNDKNKRSAELTGLVAGESYDIYMRSYSGNEVSENSTTVTQRTKPETPEDVVISSYDTTTITVGWTIDSDTVFDGFEIFYTDESTSSTQTKQVNDESKSSAELTGLVAGESYDIFMRSVSGSEVSENSTTVTQRTKPEAPEDLVISSYDTTTITVGWTIESDTVYDGFEIFYTDESTSNTQTKQVNDKSKRSAELTGLVAGESYDIYMRSVSRDEVSENSTTVTQRTKPEAPENVTISSHDTTTITVGWTIESETVYDGFEIFYTDESTSSTQTKQVNDKSKRSAELTGLVAGESYGIYMRSYSGDEVSENSTTVTQRTKPETPEDVVISSYDTTTITVGWTIESDTVYEGFEIFYSDESTSNTQTKKVNDKITRSAVLTALVAGESYDIYMRSVSGDEVSENSTTVTQRIKPETPEDVVISSYDTTTITVGWTIQSDTVYDRFEIFYTDESTSNTQTQQVNDKSKCSAELTGLITGESYDIYMRSYSVDEVSKNSSTVTQRTKPEAPEDVAISSYDTTTITVGWTIQSDTVYDRFEIFYTDESTSDTQTKQVYDNSKRSAELTGLVAGESYDIYMRSYSVDEFSENSNTVTQRTKPETPEDVVISSYDTTTITVEWTIESETVYDGFEIFYTDESTSSTQTKQVNDKSKSSAELTGLLAGESYDIYMRSYSVDEVSENSTTVTQRTKPATPEDVVISSYDTTTITVGWTMESDTVYDGFEIFYTDEITSNTQTKQVNDKDKISAELTGLVAGESYDIYMRSYSRNEVSENSTTVIQRTKPETPENVVISSYDTTTITVGWTIQSDTVYDGFEIFYTDESTSSTQTKQVNDKSKSSAELTGLVAGESYDIYMRSASGDEASENSTTVTQRTKPATPEDVVISSYDTTTITVGWTIESDTVCDRFEIFYTDESTSNTQTKEVNDKSKSSAELTELVAGESYDISMRSYSGTEVSENSTKVTQRTKPEAPEDVVISSYDTTTITVEWTIESDTFFDRFEIYYTDMDTSTTQIKQVNDSTKTSAELIGLVAGESYVIYMKSYSVNEVSEDSNTVNQRTKPEAPEDVVISSYDTTTITVGWTIDSDTVYDRFEIFYTDESASNTQSKEVNDKSKSSAELTGLVAGESYDISMRSYSGTEVSENTTTVTQRTKPKTPEDVVISSYDTTTITVGWTIEIDTVYDGFEIFYTDESTSNTQTKQVDNKNKSSAELTGLVAGESYNIYMRSHSVDEVSENSTTVTQRTNPNTVEVLKVTSPNRSTHSIMGTWTRPLGRISSYRIECNSSTGEQLHIQPDLGPMATNYTCTGLKAGHLYTMYVYTVSGLDDEEKLESEPASEDKRVYPDTAEILTTATTHDSFVVRWLQPDGHWTGYELKYDPMDNLENAIPRYEEIFDQDQNITSYTIQELYAGTQYSINVFTISGQAGDFVRLWSDPDNDTDRTIPATAVNVRAEVVETYFMDIAWDIDVTSFYDEFIVNYTGQLDNTQYIQVTSNTSTRLTDLLAGDTYAIEIYTNSDEKTSDSSVPIDETSEPLGPGAINVTSKSIHEIHIQWTEPDCTIGDDCIYDSYKITYEPEDGDIEHLSDLGLKASLVALTPGELYDIAVQVMSGKAKSKPEITRDRTLLATPEHFRVTNTTATSLLVKWDKQAGNLESYSITVDFVNEERDKTLDNIHIPLPDKDDENPASNITGLDPFTEYQVTLTCLSPEPMRTESDPTYTQEETDIAPPPPSDVQPSNDPEVIMKTKTTITVEFTDDIFKHDYGPVLYYSVIVTEDNGKGGYDDYQPERGTDPDPQMTTWSQAQGRTIRYQIEERYEYPWIYKVDRITRRQSSPSIFITIGENTTCNIDDTENYCNGPLKEGTPYRYQFRGYTEGGYSDTELSEPIVTVPGPDHSWILILLCAIVGLLLVIAVVLGVILFLRKNPEAFKKKRCARGF
ncbi:fibronectin-like [Ptychodera flava]|uniref:fibronectin-like n=1 Tax=Ptychodera flava TaxID=63121 RepID=UPI00396A1F30